MLKFDTVKLYEKMDDFFTNNNYRKLIEPFLKYNPKYKYDHDKLLLLFNESLYIVGILKNKNLWYLFPYNKSSFTPSINMDFSIILQAVADNEEIHKPYNIKM